MKTSANASQVFHFVMIKPTHYDADGYPIQWLRSAIPSNSLACLNGLAEDIRDRKALGDGVDLRLHTFDETNRRLKPERIIRMIEAEGGRGLIAFVGVQSNQFPRTMDLARRFHERDLAVCIGGFHVSGCLSMLPEMPEDLREAQAMGISLFAGEAEEGRLETLLRDTFRGELKPLYDHLGDLPGLEGEPPPILSRDHVARTFHSVTSVDLGRGCPFQCSFCTIINVQGRKSRFRTPDDLERIIRDNHRRNITSLFITDDNFARNKNWEAFLDRLIRLKEDEGIACRFTIQVDTMCHRIPNFVEKATRAGVVRVFIGLENINPDNLLAAGKKQNHIREYRQMLQMWKRHGAMIWTGYIIGFPNDTLDSVLRDIDVIKKELPIDILDLFMLTPLPGSADHLELLTKGAWMDPDMNKYDLHHRVAHHQVMADDEWEQAYVQSWKRFYTPEHMKTVVRRAAACDSSVHDTGFELMWFFITVHYEGVHPLDGGFFRLKFRRDRRPTLPRESALAFYPRYLAEIAVKTVKSAYWLAWMALFATSAERKARRRSYSDLALKSAADDDREELGLLAAR